MKTRTDATVFVDFVRQVFALGYGESQAGKELRDTGKQTNRTDIMLSACANKALISRSPPPAPWRGDRRLWIESPPGEGRKDKSATSDHLAVMLGQPKSRTFSRLRAEVAATESVAR